MLLLGLKHSGKPCEDLIIHGLIMGSSADGQLSAAPCLPPTPIVAQDNDTKTNKTRSPAHRVPELGRCGH